VRRFIKHRAGIGFFAPGHAFPRPVTSLTSVSISAVFFFLNSMPSGAGVPVAGQWCGSGKQAQKEKG
jgi:hypothetical protein